MTILKCLSHGSPYAWMASSRRAGAASVLKQNDKEWMQTLLQWPHNTLLLCNTCYAALISLHTEVGLTFCQHGPHTEMIRCQYLPFVVTHFPCSTALWYISWCCKRQSVPEQLTRTVNANYNTNRNPTQTLISSVFSIVRW